MRELSFIDIEHQKFYRQEVSRELSFIDIEHQSLHRREWRFIDACYRGYFTAYQCAGFIGKLRWQNRHN